MSSTGLRTAGGQAQTHAPPPHRYLQPGPWPVLSKGCTTGRPAAGRCPKELPGGAHACPSETSGHFLGSSRPFFGRGFKFHVWTPAAHTLWFPWRNPRGPAVQLVHNHRGLWQRTRPCPRPASRDMAAWTRPGGSTQTGGQRGPHPPLAATKGAAAVPGPRLGGMFGCDYCAYTVALL